MAFTSLKMAAAGAVAVGVAASGLGTVAAAPTAVPAADYPPTVKTVSPQPSVSNNRKNVIVKVRPKVNRKFDVKVQIRKNGKWVQTRFVYRTDRKNQKVKIPVNPGRYRFRVLPRKANKINTAFLGGTSKVVKVPKN